MIHVHTALLAAEEAAGSAVGVPPLLAGAAAFGALVALLLVAYAFRSVGTRH